MPQRLQPETSLPRLTFHVALQASRLLRARERIRDYLRAHCDDERLIDEVVLCIEEACTNAIRHSGAHEDLLISMGFQDGDLRVEVTDRGRGFDVEAFDPDETPDLLATGGRGLYLIARLMDELELRADGGLEVRMLKRDALRHSRAPAAVDAAWGEHLQDGPRSRMRAMLEEIDEAFVAIDWEYRVAHANQAARRLAGVPAAGLAGRPLWDVMPVHAELSAACRDAMELGRPAVLEARSDVTGRWLEARVYPTSAGVSIYLRDIDARKRRELQRDEYLAALRRSEGRYRSLFDSLQEAFFLAELVTDDHGRPADYRYVEVNPAYERLVGAGREELVGRLATAVDPELDREWIAALGEVALTGRSLHHTQFARRSRRYLEVVAFSPAPGRVGALVTDVTDRKDAEDKLRQRTEELGERVRLAESLAVVDRVARSARGIDAVVRKALEEGMRALGAHAAALQMRDAGTWFVRYQLGFTPEALGLRLSDGEAPIATRALLGGDVVVVPDVAADPAADVGFTHEQGVKGAIAVPLIARGDTLGCLLFHYRTKREFRPAEIDFVRNLGASVSLALENARLHSHSRPSERASAGARDGRVLALVARWRRRPVRVLAAACLLEVLYLTLLDAFTSSRQALGVPGSLVTLTVVVAAALAGPLVGMVAAAVGGATFYLTVGDVGASSTLSAALAATVVWMVSALLAGYLAEALHRQGQKREAASVALARAAAEREAQLSEQRRVETLAADLHAEREQLRTIIEQADYSIALLDRDYRFILVNSGYAATWGLTPEQMVGMNHFDLHPYEDSEAIFRTVAETGEPYQAEARPFEFRDQPERGVTYWDWRVAPTWNGEGEVDGLVFSLVDVTGRVRAQRLSEALNEINAAVSAGLEPDRTMREALRLTGEALGCKAGMLLVRTAGGWSPAEVWNLPAELAGQRLEASAVGCLERSLAERQPAFDGCGGLRPAVDEPVSSPRSLDISCTIPLVVADETLGALVLTHGVTRVRDGAEVDFARKAGAAVSQALENARLFREQRRVATTLQENLLHELPAIPGLEFGRVSRAAYEPELVGGDFSDVFAIDDELVAVLIGDVAGKGVRAAGLTETVHTAVTSFALVDPSPATILRRTNELLLGRAEDDQFVTAFLAVLDRRTGEAAYASAGHPAPALIRSWSCELLDGPHGMPLGTFPFDYHVARVVLQSGDCLVLYTDGVTEARRSRELFGDRRILDALRSLHGLEAQDVAEQLRDEASAFAGRLRDDLQVLAVRLTGPLFDQPLELGQEP